MSKSIDIVRILTLGLAAFPTTAVAGAWTLKANEATAVVTETASRADRGFDGSGNLEPVSRYSKSELQAFLEYGATDWLTFMLAPSLQHVSIGGPFEARRTGLGYADIGGRMRIWEANSWVVSAQTTIRIPGTNSTANVAAIGYTDPELDIRGLFGHSFAAGTWQGFIDVQLARRFRFGAPPDEFRADLTLGLQPDDRWLFLIQSFNVISEGAGDWLHSSYGYYKAQLSAVYAVTPALSFQFGGYTTYAGRNALQENGLVLGAWYRF